VVTVEAEPGVVGEVGAELDEERAEVGVDAVEVEVVDHPGGLDDPRVGPARGVVPFLGPEQRRLLLGPADEDHALSAPGRLEPGQVLMHHVVLVLVPGEVHPRDLLLAGETVDRGGEAVGNLAQRRGRGDRQPQLPVDVPDQPGRVLKVRDVHVQVHPVDALDLEGDCSARISDTLRGKFMTGSGRTGGQHGLPTATTVHTPDRLAGHGLTPDDRSPHTQSDHDTARRAGRSPVRTFVRYRTGGQTRSKPTEREPIFRRLRRFRHTGSSSVP
jgi:hypothetical protein